MGGSRDARLWDVYKEDYKGMRSPENCSIEGILTDTYLEKDQHFSLRGSCQRAKKKVWIHSRHTVILLMLQLPTLSHDPKLHDEILWNSYSSHGFGYGRAFNMKKMSEVIRPAAKAQKHQ